MSSNNSSNNNNHDDDSHDDDITPIVDNAPANALQAWCMARVRESISALHTVNQVTGGSTGDNISMMQSHADAIISRLSGFDANAMDMRVLIPAVAYNNAILDEDARIWNHRLGEALDYLKRTNHDLFSLTSVRTSTGTSVDNAISDTAKREMIDEALSDSESKLHGILSENIKQTSRRMLSYNASLDAIITVLASTGDYYLNTITDWNQSLAMITGSRMCSASAVYGLQIEPMTRVVLSTLDEAVSIESECRKYVDLIAVNEKNARMRHLLRMAPSAYPGRISMGTVNDIITGAVDPSALNAGENMDSDNNTKDGNENSDVTSMVSGFGITLDAVRMLSDDATRSIMDARLKITEGWRGLAGPSLLAANPIDDETWLRWSVDGFTDGIDAMQQHDALTNALSTLTGINA